MIRRTWLFLAVALLITGAVGVFGSAASAALPGSMAMSAPPPGGNLQQVDSKQAAGDPWGIQNFDCSRINELRINQQMNLRAAAIMEHCSGNKTAQAEQKSSNPVGSIFGQLRSPLAYGGPDKDNIVGETQNFLQSESWVWSNGNTVVVTFNDFRGLNLSPRILCGASTSTDGGATFTYLPVNTFGGLGRCDGDPFHYYSARANKWFAGFFAAGTGGCGASGIGQWESVDGINWTTSGCTHTGSSDDRFSGWVDNKVGSPFFGYQYVIFSNFALTNAPLQVVRSTDDGVTWSAAQTLSSRPGGGANRPVQLTGSLGTDGTVFAQSMDEGGGGLAARINYIHRTTDGGASWTQIQQGPAFPAPGSGTCPAQPFFAIIPGPWRHQGWGQPGVGPNNVVHYAYAQHGAAADQGDIMYIRSTDNGSTWSSPTKLNTDATTRAQWMPSLAVNSQGSVFVGWYDRRNTANNDYERFGRASTDNGLSWQADMAVSDVIIPQWAPDPSTAACYGGDYDYAMASDSGQGTDFYQTWNDGRVVQGGVNQMNVFFDKIPLVGGTPTPTHTGTPPTATPTRTSTNTPVPSATPCAFTQVINEGFEAGTLGVFTSTVIITSTTTPVPTPGWASVASNPHSGTRSAFAPDPDRTTDSRLTTINNINIPTGVSTATLTFWHRFAFEDVFDGGVLEVSTDGGANWVDADANIQQGGYNGTITVFQGCVTAGTPPPFAANRRVWTGSMTTYGQVRVNLVPYAGTNMKFRFRLGTDCSVSNTGWNVDDVVVTYAGVCATVTGTPPTATTGTTSTVTPISTVVTTTPAATSTCVPSAGGWTQGAVLPVPLVRAWGVYFPPNGKFYSMGGRTADAAGAGQLNPLEYTPSTDTWVTKAAAFGNQEVSNMLGGVLTMSGTPVIVMVGGSQSAATSGTQEVRSYNPLTDQLTVISSDPWISGTTTIPGGVAVHSNKLYILGGFIINAGMSDQIWEFDPARAAGSRWLLKNARLPQELGYIPTTTIGNFIYTGGGSLWDGTTLQDSDFAFRYDPVADTIISIPTVPTVTAETRAVTVNGEMWVLGGGRNAPNPSSTVQIYSPTTNSWRSGSSFVLGRRNFPADTDGAGAIYLAGGYSPTAPTDNMEIFHKGVTCGSPTVTITVVPPTTTRTVTPVSTICPPVVNYVLDDGAQEDSVGLGNGTTNFPAIWLNRVSPSAGTFPINLTQISIQWPNPTSAGVNLVGKTVDLLVYLDADANADPSNATKIAQVAGQTITVADGTTFQNFPVNITIPGPGEVYFGFADTFNSGGVSPVSFPSPLDTTASQVRSWVVGRSTNADPDYDNLGNNDLIGTIDSFGLPGNWVIRASGTGGPGCGSPTVVPPTSTAVASATSVSTATTQATSTTVPATTTSTAVPPTSCPLQFTDVPPSNTFYQYIRCLVCRFIVSGYNDGTFRPNNNITRGQIAKMVSNAAGINDNPGEQFYEDVNNTNPFYVWINRLSRRGYIGGYPCGTTTGEPCGPDNLPYFRPVANATRGQLSKIVATAAQFNEPVSGQFFADVETDNPFYVWIQRLATRNIMGGYPCGTVPSEPCDDQNRPYFRWSNEVTRGQAAKIVAGAFFPNCETPGGADNAGATGPVKVKSSKQVRSAKPADTR